jgi:glycosyltransferase involved in cell wall biosynthesis
MTRPAPVLGIVLKGFPRLSETFVTRELRGLEESGHELHLFAIRDPGERRVDDEARRVCAHITYLPDRFTWKWGDLVSAQIAARRARPAAYDRALRLAIARTLRERSFATLKRFLQAGWLVARGLPGTGVVHLHAHFAHDPTSVAFFAARLSGLPFSFSAHAKDIFAQDPAWLAAKIAEARLVVTCTDHNRERLEALVPDARVLLAYHGIQTERFVPAARDQSGDAPDLRRPPELLSIGRLVPKKGFLVLLEALARLARRGVAFHATLVGDGPLRGRLLARIDELGLKGRVTLVASTPQSELIARFRAADLFVLACEVQPDGDRDGIPNVIFEAMAMELPVVATRVSGIPECIEHGASGVLVAEQDAAALADAIADLLADPARARAIGRAARLRVATRFEAGRHFAIIERALRAAVAAAAAPRAMPALGSGAEAIAAPDRSRATPVTPTPSTARPPENPEATEVAHARGA